MKKNERFTYDEELAAATTDQDRKDAAAGKWNDIWSRACAHSQSMCLGLRSWEDDRAVDQLARQLWGEERWADLTRLSWLTRRTSEDSTGELLTRFNNGEGEIYS